MSEEKKQDESSDNWFKRALADVNARLSGRQVNRISRGLLTPQEEAQKIHEVWRGNETKKLLQGDFWKKSLSQSLNERTAVKPAQPGQYTSLESATIDHLIASGKANLGAELLRLFEEWIRAGDEAQEKLKENEERKKQISVLRR